MAKSREAKIQKVRGRAGAAIGAVVGRSLLAAAGGVVVATLMGSPCFADAGANAALLSAQILLAPVCNDGQCENFDRSCRSCARPVSNGALPLVSDALMVLRAAVGQAGCTRCICDVDGSGGIQATDALVTLRRAVGQGIALKCPES